MINYLERNNIHDHLKSVIFAMLTCVSFTIYNFVAVSKSHLGYLVRFILGIGMSLCILFNYVLFERHKRAKAEQKPFHKRDKRYQISIIIGATLAFLNDLASGSGVVYTFYFAAKAGVNQGVISSIYCLTPGFAAIMFYITFKEVLKLSQIIGMLMIMSCAFFIGYGVKDKDIIDLSVVSDTYETRLFYAFCGILVALCCSFAFSLDGYIIKYMNVNYDIDSTEFIEVEYLIQGVTLALLTIFAFTYGGFLFNLDDFTFILIGGFFAGFGEMCMGIALMYGKAGVVISLINSQCIFLIVINYFAFNEIPSTLEIIAAAIGIAGVVVISLGSEIYLLFRCLSKKHND